MLRRHRFVNVIPSSTPVRLRCALAGLTLLALLAPPAASPVSRAFAADPPAVASAAASEPLGIGLEGFPYPYPVRFLSLEIERAPVRMAFMDVAPTGQANGRVALLLHGKNFYGNAWAGTIRRSWATTG